MPNFRLLHLNLSFKTALYFTFGLFGMIVSFLLISRYFFLYSVDELESMEISAANQQAQAVIQIMVKQQEKSSYDWAYWDETHDLLKNGDLEKYRDRNLYIESIDSLDLDMMGFITLNGLVLDSLTRELDHNESNVFVKDVMLQSQLQRHLELTGRKADIDRDSLAGLFKINQNVWILSLTPVRDSEGVSESSGWLLWGRNLTFRFPGYFKSILSADNVLNVIPTNEPTSGTVNRLEKTTDLIAKSSVLYDVSHSPIATLTTQAPRVLYKKSSVLFIYLLATVFVAASVIAAITLIIFKKGVSNRFNYFASGINQIASQYQLEGTRSVDADELELAIKLVQKISENSSVTESQLKDSLEKFAALYQSTTLGMLLIIDRTVIDANQKALDLLNYQRAEIIDQPLKRLWGSDTEDYRVTEMLQTLKNDRTQLDTQILDRNGAKIDCLIEATTIQHRGQDALMLLVQDQRETKQQAQIIQELTEFDPVSGFCNRPIILAALNDSLINHPKDFSFIYINSDGLKQISEVYGHHIFDQAIQYIASLLRTQMKGYQIGRISEFEFIVIIPSSDDYQHALHAANTLLAHLSHKVEIAGLMLSIDCKAVAVDPKITHQSLEHLLLVTRYTAQSIAGQDRTEVVITGETLSAQAQTSMILHRDLELAIRNHAITPYFQPIVCMHTGNVTGFEALARWIHPTLGVVSPAVFIPMAEQNKLIIELGESILAQSYKFISQLNDQRRSHGCEPLSVHVNVSAQHFYHARLTSFLQSIIDQNKPSSGQLVLEITESMLVGSEKEVLQRMNEIKQLGVQLALDDFGTGFASFISLCSLPLDIIKLDKSYIDKIENNTKAKTLVRNIANLSRELGMTIVAEGVETPNQVQKLKAWNIDELQGFYFYKPMPLKDVLEQFSTR